MISTKTFAAILLSIGCLCLSARGLAAGTHNVSKEKGLTNPFFAMDTGTKDAKHQTAEAQAEMLKELGYAGIGYGGFGGLSEMLEELDKNSLKMSAVYTGAWIDANKPKYDPQLKQSIKLLKGRDTIIWLFIQSEEHALSSPTGDPLAVEIIRDIADVAHESGLKVALYPHTGFWLERVEDAVRLAKKANRRNVGVTFNLCHWLKVDSEKNMKPLMKLAMPYLFVVAINGADSGGDNWNQLIQTLDRGSFDIYEFLKTLTELGYAGPIGLQGYGIKGDAHDNLKRSMDAWRKLSARIADERM
ncbi:sugar phosphate isomerase/epimerase [bacterium]|nr:sugar phosphate isomerase/epimerase [bacterium]